MFGAPHYVTELMWGVRGRNRPAHHMVPYQVSFYPSDELSSNAHTSIDSRVTKKYDEDEALRSLKVLRKVDPQFKESKDGSSHVLKLDLSVMDNDVADVGECQGIWFR